MLRSRTVCVYISGSTMFYCPQSENICRFVVIYVMWSCFDLQHFVSLCIMRLMTGNSTSENVLVYSDILLLLDQKKNGYDWSRLSKDLTWGQIFRNLKMYFNIVFNLSYVQDLRYPKIFLRYHKLIFEACPHLKIVIISKKLLAKIKSFVLKIEISFWFLITAQCYASVMCTVCPSVCHKPLFYQNGYTLDHADTAAQSPRYCSSVIRDLVKFKCGHP